MKGLPPLLNEYLIIPPSGSMAFGEINSSVESSSNFPSSPTIKSTCTSSSSYSNFGAKLLIVAEKEAAGGLMTSTHTYYSFSRLGYD